MQEFGSKNGDAFCLRWVLHAGGAYNAIIARSAEAGKHGETRQEREPRRAREAQTDYFAADYFAVASLRTRSSIF